MPFVQKGDFQRLNLDQFTLDSTVVTATGLELNQSSDISERFIAGGSSLSATVAAHNGKIIKLDTAAGTTVTLPAATGSGAIFRFVTTVIATSGSHIIKVANASDTMQGFAILADTDSSGATFMFMCAADSDTMTMNRSTQGSVTIGETVEVIDIATNKFQVRGFLSATGNPATPFTAGV